MPNADPIHDAREAWNEHRAAVTEHTDRMLRALDELADDPDEPGHVLEVRAERSRLLWSLAALLEKHHALFPASKPPASRWPATQLETGGDRAPAPF